LEKYFRTLHKAIQKIFFSYLYYQNNHTPSR